jgi:hypothetical protein
MFCAVVQQIWAKSSKRLVLSSTLAQRLTGEDSTRSNVFAEPDNFLDASNAA